MNKSALYNAIILLADADETPLDDQRFINRMVKELGISEPEYRDLMFEPLTQIDECKDRITRRRELVKDAVDAVNELYQRIGIARKEDVNVSISDEDLVREIVTVKIGKGTYRVNVESDSYPAIVREIVDATALKI